MGLSEVFGTGRFIFGGSKEEGSSGIVQGKGNKQGGESAPGNDDGTGIRAGYKVST